MVNTIHKPGPRAFHTATSIDGGRAMVVFGGTRPNDAEQEENQGAPLVVGDDQGDARGDTW